VLCRRFAVIRAGASSRSRTPGEARALIHGRILPRNGADGSRALERLTANSAVTTDPRRRPTPGSHLRADGLPPVGFLPVEPNLEDAYFVLYAGPEAGEAVDSLRDSSWWSRRPCAPCEAPLTWVLLVIMVSRSGACRRQRSDRQRRCVSSGDESWITSEFAVAHTLSIVCLSTPSSCHRAGMT
jgi:hypothetical protein